MRFKLAAFVFAAAACLPAAAHAMTARTGLSQGNVTVVSGRAHVWEGAEGTYIDIAGPGSSIAGFIPFGDKHAYPELAGIEGRRVVISGVVERDGGALIIMTDPAQLAVLS